MKKKNNTKRVATKIGAGFAAVTAAAALSYYFYGSKDAKGHRKIVATWANDLKREVIREAKQLKEIGPDEFSSIVDRVARAYRDIRAIDPKELSRATRELKENWETVLGKAYRKKKQIKKLVEKSRSRSRSSL